MFLTLILISFPYCLETIFFEGPPAASEMIIPALSIVTVLGIIPFVSALARQAWVRYKFTSRRISIASGIGGKEVSEIIYPGNYCAL